MLGLSRKLIIETERMSLRLPVQSDFKSWVMLREESIEFLEPWEPSWSIDHLSKKNFNNRVYWSQKAVGDGTAVPVFMILRSTGKILGAITLDNIRRGPSQVGTLGYWIGKNYARNLIGKQSKSNPPKSP